MLNNSKTLKKKMKGSLKIILCTPNTTKTSSGTKTRVMSLSKTGAYWLQMWWIMLSHITTCCTTVENHCSKPYTCGVVFCVLVSDQCFDAHFCELTTQISTTKAQYLDHILHHYQTKSAISSLNLYGYAHPNGSICLVSYYY